MIANKISGNYKNRITRKISLQYLFTFMGFIFGLLLFVFIAYQLTNNITWQATNPFYKTFKFVKEYRIIFLVIPIIIGWAFITYFFIKKPLRYLDEVIFASEKLAHPTDEQIILSDAMKSVQDELNQVRKSALYNIQLAKETEQRKNDLIVYLAHDLKTPLTSVIGYLTLLCDEKQISEQTKKKYLSISLNKAQRLEDLINEFFETTRFNLSKIEIQYSNVNLTRLLQQLVFEFNPMLLDKSLQCNLSIPLDVIVNCDANKIQRVFDNLLRNAVFYSFENSIIEIKVTQNATKTFIAFINHGNNIPSEKLERIFEQFYRLDTSRNSNNGGAGLGLAIAAEIITVHHGLITVTSENQMIEFCVTLPTS